MLTRGGRTRGSGWGDRNTENTRVKTPLPSPPPPPLISCQLFLFASRALSPQPLCPRSRSRTRDRVLLRDHDRKLGFATAALSSFLWINSAAEEAQSPGSGAARTTQPRSLHLSSPVLCLCPPVHPSSSIHLSLRVFPCFCRSGRFC